MSDDLIMNNAAMAEVSAMIEDLRWVPVPDGDGCGWMAFPLDYDKPDGFWRVTDCEGDALCVCQKETAVWLHMLLNKYCDTTDDRTGYCNKIAAEMVEDGAGMCGSWDEFLNTNEIAP